METTKNMFKIALPIILSAALFSGCYTQLASTREEEENGYNDNRSYATQESSDSTYNDNGNSYNDDYRRSCMGYYYSVPVWQTSWYYSGCIYPTYWSYWDAWWLSPGWVYPAYYYGGYHPYYGGYWHGHDGYYAHNYSQPRGVRSGGYTRANYNGRNEFDFARSTTSTGSLAAPSAGRISSSATRTNGSVSTSTRTAASQSSGTYRNFTVGRSARTYSPSIQQPQYRNQSNGTRTQRSTRASSSRSYSTPATRSASSSTQHSTPSFSAPSTRTTPAPSSAPSRDNGSSNGGGSQSSGGRSGGGKR